MVAVRGAELDVGRERRLGNGDEGMNVRILPNRRENQIGLTDFYEAVAGSVGYRSQ
jgi:hypothetical protein